MSGHLPVDVYVRVSRVGGREHLTSPADQEREARSFAQSRGLQVGEVLTDLDQSGGTLDRPGLAQALARVASGVSGGIVVAYLSRASRDTRQGLDLLDRITAAGGTVWAPNLPENYRTADGRMTATIQLAIDAGYRERKAEEFERAKAGAVAAGVAITPRPAVGYRKREDRRLEPDPATAPTIAKAFALRAGGAGPVQLAEHLEAHGVLTSMGSATWSKQAIYNLIQNRVYLGELTYGRDSRLRNANAHEPIVDVATWTAAQRPAGTGATRLARTASTSSWLLSGIARCQACRYCMQGTMTGRRKRIYRCTRRHSGGICSAPSRVDADRLEEDVTAAFWQVAEVRAVAGGVGGVDERIELDAALERAELRLAQVETEDAQDAFGARWMAVVRERREARDAAAEAAGAAEARAMAIGAPVQVNTLRELWEVGGVPARRDLIASLLDCVAVGRDPYRVDVYPAGSAPVDLPRRGYKSSPVLKPFPDR